MKKDSEQKTNKLIASMFPGISSFCIDECKKCCKTYGWLLKKETKKVLKGGQNIAKVNNKIFCIDSFERDHGKIILNKVPRCVFYENYKCKIYNNRPMDCRLYPLKIIFIDGVGYIVLSKDCNHIKSLSQNKLLTLTKNIKRTLDKIPRQVLYEYIDMIEQIYAISGKKKFNFKRIGTVRKSGKKWKLSFYK